MKIQAALLLILTSFTGVGEATTLSLPDNATLTFDAPPMNKVVETTEGATYKYLATSAGSADDRFNLSVYVEPINCDFGKSTKKVTECFLKRTEKIPGIHLESRSNSCGRGRCEVMYATTANVGNRQVRQLHVHAIFTYRGKWVDLHISVLNPTQGDSNLLVHFADSLALRK